MPAKRQQKSKKGNKHATNLHRSEHKREHYKENLRRRANAGDTKAQRLLDESRQKAGKKQGAPVW